MRLIVILLVIVCIAAIGYKRGWFEFEKTKQDDHTNYTVTVEKDNWKHDRDEFQKKSQARLTQLDRYLEELKSKASVASAETRDAWNRKVADWQVMRDAAAEDMKHLSGVTEEKWQETKKKVSDSLNSLDERIHHLTDGSR